MPHRVASPGTPGSFPQHRASQAQAAYLKGLHLNPTSADCKARAVFWLPLPVGLSACRPGCLAAWLLGGLPGELVGLQAAGWRTGYPRA